jgi:hypothetical protein
MVEIEFLLIKMALDGNDGYWSLLKSAGKFKN